MPYLYFYFAKQESTAVESAQQAAESTATTTVVESTAGAVASVAGPLQATNVTVNASAKMIFFIVLFTFIDCYFIMVIEVHQPVINI